jgi:ADP-heptose:LPS heptosyltransferase
MQPVSEMAGPNRILVTRNDKLGDVVLATPVFLSLRRSFPKAYIAALVGPAGYEVVRDNPRLDEILVDDERGKHRGWPGFKLLVEEIRQRQFDAALILFSDWRMGALCRLAGIPERIGPASKLAQVFYTRRILQHRSRSTRHEADYNLELAEVLGATPVRTLEVWTSSEVEQEAERFFNELRLPSRQPLIGIHPGGGGSSKPWSVERYAQLADGLADKLGAAVFITHGPGEEEMVEQLASSLKAPPYRYPGSYGIQLLAELIKRFKVFISSNTGPMHLAAAVGTPTVSLFSPLIVCRPQRWGPIGNKHIVLAPDLPACKKCRPHKCGHPECLDLIPAERVLEAAANLL